MGLAAVPDSGVIVARENHTHLFLLFFSIFASFVCAVCVLCVLCLCVCVCGDTKPFKSKFKSFNFEKIISVLFLFV